MIWWALASLVALAAAAPFLREAMRPRLGAATRRQAPGRFVHLPRGVTHYRWLGADDGPVVVCVHGLTTASYVWEAIAPALGRLGYRVLVYDLYGRGFSDRPRGEQDSTFFVGQLEALLDALDIADAITLVGYSMGGAIATAFAARHPGRVARLVLLAPAGLGHDLGPVARLVTRRSFFADWLMRAFYARSYRGALEAERALDSHVEDIVDRQLGELRHRGFVPAVQASLRGILDEDMAPAHRAVAEAGVPVLAIWAAEDEVIPLEAGRATLAHWNPQAEQAVIEGAGHALAYTHDAEVVAHVTAGNADAGAKQ
ncbi:alpha/beta fold hydrolase [Roseovarius salinarum]|uniref:alpha/beta fold hydrolase n=1 Tax=Roseovarius salinarum TaxID=1981892 RepID=UPI000C33326D|nr:alpha/beta hydrolase [Roseovarius salinarum]